MRNWSIQKFLNPGSSNDDGWFKFSVRARPRSGRGEPQRAPSIKFIISDCSNKIYLEFEPEHVYRDDDGKITEYSKKVALDSVNERIRKMNLFADSVNKARDKITQALDEYAAFVEDIDTER